MTTPYFRALQNQSSRFNRSKNKLYKNGILRSMGFSNSEINKITFMINQSELKERISNIGITYKRLSELSGVDKSYISLLCNEYRTLTKEKSNCLEPVILAYEKALNSLK